MKYSAIVLTIAAVMSSGAFAAPAPKGGAVSGMPGASDKMGRTTLSADQLHGLSQMWQKESGEGTDAKSDDLGFDDSELGDDFSDLGGLDMTEGASATDRMRSDGPLDIGTSLSGDDSKLADILKKLSASEKALLGKIENVLHKNPDILGASSSDALGLGLDTEDSPFSMDDPFGGSENGDELKALGAGSHAGSRMDMSGRGFGADLDIEFKDGALGEDDSE